MKKVNAFMMTAIMVLLGLGANAGTVQQLPDVKEVQIGINDVFVPSGFDSNSDVYVVTNGIFPNGCYRWSRADVKHTDAFTHEVRSFSGC